MWNKIIKQSVPFAWLGMVLAISFMEAPLKFQAPGITIPLGLGIGQLVFFALNKMEIVCGLLLLLAFWRGRDNTRSETFVFGVALVILVLETIWVLPVLDARAEEVIAGTAPPFSNLHLVYIFLDAAKLVLLLALGILVTRRHLSRSANN